MGKRKLLKHYFLDVYLYLKVWMTWPPYLKVWMTWPPYLRVWMTWPPLSQGVDDLAPLISRSG